MTCSLNSCFAVPQKNLRSFFLCSSEYQTIVIQFIRSLWQVRTVPITKRNVTSQPLRSGLGSDYSRRPSVFRTVDQLSSSSLVVSTEVFTLAGGALVAKGFIQFFDAQKISLVFEKLFLHSWW